MGKLINTQPGYVYTNSGAAAIKAGDIVVNNSLFGVAASPIPVGGKGLVFTAGTFALDITAGVTANQGAVAYWDATNSTIVATSGSGANAAIGYFVKAVTSTDTVAEVIIG